MHQVFFRPDYNFNNHAYFLDFCAQKFPLIFFNVNPFLHQQALHFGSPPVIFIAGRPKAALLLLVLW